MNILVVYLTDTHLKENNIDSVKIVFRKAMNFALENHLSRVVHLGDNFHSRKSQSQIIFDSFEEILDEYKANGITLVSITGNHDKTDYRKSKSFLSPFKHHPAFHLIENGYIEHLGNIDIYYLSYFDEDLYAEQLLELIESDVNFQSDRRRILRTHIGVNGAVMNNGVSIESEIGEDLLSLFDAVHIGHYHDKQFFDNVHYIGASLQHNFGESDQKGFVVCYEDFDLETHNIEEVSKFINIEVNVSDLDQEMIKDIQSIQEEGRDSVKIVLIGTEDELKATTLTDELNRIGVKVAKKQKKITKQDLDNDDWVKPETTEDLIQAFEDFCDENNYQKGEGLTYLKLTLCINQ